jgi:hypothetical protein
MRSTLSLLLPLLLPLACGDVPDEPGEERADVAVVDDPLLLPTDPAPATGDQGGGEADDEGQPEEPIVEEPARPDLPSGGYLEATRFVSGDESSSGALAELWSGVDGPAEPGRLMYEVFPEDACFSIPGSATTPTFYDFVDVGAQITLRGAENVALERQSLFSNIFYKAFGGASSLQPGQTYDVEHADGAWQDALRMPEVPVVHAPAEFPAGLVWFPESGDLDVSFAPTGADRVYLILQRDDAGVVCRLADDGECRLSSAAVAGAPEWGTLVLLALNHTWVEHDGRAVEVIGTAGLVAEFER